MKNWIILGILVIVTTVIFSSGAQDVGNGRLPVMQSLRVHERDSSLIHQAFRGQASSRLNESERVIDEFVATLEKERKQVRNKNSPKVMALEQEIALLRIRMFNHKTGEGNGWMGFQREITQDLDSIDSKVGKLKIEKN